MIKYIFKSILIMSVVLFLYSIYSLFWNKDKVIAYEKAEGSIMGEILAPAEKIDRVEKLNIEDGMTFGMLMDEAGIAYSTQMEIYNAAVESYDLVKIRVGKTLDIIHDKDTDEFKELVYQIDSEEELRVRKVKAEVKTEGASTTSVTENQEINYDWKAEVSDIQYEVRIKTTGGIVESSMYQAALDNSIDERAIIALADVFQWTIDFSQDPRKGDTFKFVYEERYINGEYIMPGRILAGQYNNAGQKNELYYFEENSDNIGYFDENGNSAQKMFLKAPVSFRYISSGFTTGLRYIEAFNVSTGHRAIDYAAALGTPIRAVGDGTVTSAAWNSGGYGNLIKIKHNGTYSTNYGHLSKFAIRSGQKVKQGDVIGYVGSTGFSTGPHLHYEMVKNGVKINPLLEVQPPGKAIAGESKEKFNIEKNKFFEMMDKVK